MNLRNKRFLNPIVALLVKEVPLIKVAPILIKLDKIATQVEIIFKRIKSTKPQKVQIDKKLNT